MYTHVKQQQRSSWNLTSKTRELHDIACYPSLDPDGPDVGEPAEGEGGDGLGALRDGARRDVRAEQLVGRELVDHDLDGD